LRMQEGALGLSEIADPKLINCVSGEGPSMREVRLLRAESIGVAESLKQIRRSRLEPGKRLCIEGVIKVVVEAQVLLVVNPVVQFHRELVSMRIFIRNGTKDVVATGGEIGAVRVCIRTRDVTLQDVGCSRVEAIRRNLVAGESLGVRN